MVTFGSKKTRWRRPKWKLEASKRKSTNQWVTPWMLSPLFVVYKLKPWQTFKLLATSSILYAILIAALYSIGRPHGIYHKRTLWQDVASSSSIQHLTLWFWDKTTRQYSHISSDLISSQKLISQIDATPLQGNIKSAESGKHFLHPESSQWTRWLQPQTTQLTERRLTDIHTTYPTGRIYRRRQWQGQQHFLTVMI